MYLLCLPVAVLKWSCGLGHTDPFLEGQVPLWWWEAEGQVSLETGRGLTAGLLTTSRPSHSMHSPRILVWVEGGKARASEPEALLLGRVTEGYGTAVPILRKWENALIKVAFTQ